MASVDILKEEFGFSELGIEGEVSAKTILQALAAGAGGSMSVYHWDSKLSRCQLHVYVYDNTIWMWQVKGEEVLYVVRYYRGCVRNTEFEWGSVVGRIEEGESWSWQIGAEMFVLDRAFGK